VESAPHPPLLERLFSESSGDLSRYFTRRHGAGEAVQDLVQETFLQMARSLEDGRKLECARGYLFGIARRISQAAWTQRQKDQNVVPFDPEASNSHGEVAIAVMPGDDRVTAARETIAGLSPLQREILDLRFSQDLSYAEIAQVLGIPVGTVRSRIHHAVAEVRQRLSADASGSAHLNP
jgi:RNA polymerase sigma-70 factor (ECF subfamily)